MLECVPAAVPALVQEQWGRGAQKGPGLAYFGDKTFSPRPRPDGVTVIPLPRRPGLDGVTATPAPRRSPGQRCGQDPRGERTAGAAPRGTRGWWGKRFAWGKTAGLTERREEPSYFWFLSKHF